MAACSSPNVSPPSPRSRILRHTFSRNHVRVSAQSRSPFPLEHFESLEFPSAARFMWANGARVGPGLRKLPLEVAWLEQCTFRKWNEQICTKARLLEKATPNKQGSPLVWDDGADAAAKELWNNATTWLAKRYPDKYDVDKHKVKPRTAVETAYDKDHTTGLDAFVALASIIQEDIFLMRATPEHPEGYVFVAGASCFSFDPVKRKNKGLLSLHEPVPWYPEMAAAVRRAFDNLNVDRPLYRANFAFQNFDDVITTDVPWHPRFEERIAADELDAKAGHTSYFDTTQPVPTTPEGAKELYVRVEYETLTRLPINDDFILFTVKTYVDKLDEFPKDAKLALLEGLQRADDGQKSYKSIDTPELYEALISYLSL
ncbi:choline monooxygenase [Pycnococcus provasolii]|mmetsp:Transcript_670/g.1797  ORF Transcript_670/g.1797 Transcript_670/m.1797 type:complete len:372 (-) Transcript_670:45-1160(-)